jgi:GNAT superfamily N-acetyltransferase
MAGITIRNAVLGNAVRMAEILREIGWSSRRNSLPLEEVSRPIEKLIEHCIKDSHAHSMLVAVDDSGAVLGFTCVHWVPFVMLGSWEGYVSDMFVSPEASGMGVGTALIERVIEEGESRGCMRLMVTNGKEKASYKLGFYKKLGWTERPSVANFVYYYREPWS